MTLTSGEIDDFNRGAWDHQVVEGNRWTRPVDEDTIRRARAGDWSVVLTPTRPVPRDWFPPLEGADVLGLASGGGQQGPILAAAGARVTVYDLSENQLAQDRMVAERDGLPVTTVHGRMEDLSAFADDRFDLIFHPCSNVFTPNVRAVWREAARVLKPGGVLLAGFGNPVLHAADEAAADAGEIRLVHRIPYADADHPTVVAERRAQGRPLEFGHRLGDQLGGQLDAGLLLTGLYEDHFGGNDVYERAFDALLPTFIATRAIRPAG